MTEPNPSEKPSWFERPKNINLMIVGLVIACVALLAIELICSHYIHDEHHHASFKMEEVFGYQAWIGFIAFVVVVALGSLLRLVIRQPEDYYDR